MTKKSSISSEHGLDITMSGMSNSELIEKGKEKWDPSPSSTSAQSQNPQMTSATANYEEIKIASNSLVNASDSIVEGVLLVIGALEEQNKYQKAANNNLYKIICDLTTLHSEMIRTRNDNRSVKRIMLVVLIGMLFIFVTSVYAIDRNFKQIKFDNAQNIRLQEQLETAIKIAKEAKNMTIAAAKLSQNKSEVLIRPADGKNKGAVLEISQPVSQKTEGNTVFTERDTVRIPIRLDNAKMRPPVTTIMDGSLKKTTVEHEGKTKEKH